MASEQQDGLVARHRRRCGIASEESSIEKGAMSAVRLIGGAARGTQVNLRRGEVFEHRSGKRWAEQKEWGVGKYDEQKNETA